MDAVGPATVYGCGAYFEPAYIIKSTNSGATWTYKDMSAYATALVEIKFVNETVGYAAGKNTNGAIILKTIDGGDNWTEIYNSAIAGEYVWKLQIFNENTNVVFGSIQPISPSLGRVLKSVNAGVNWTSVDAPVTDVQAVGFISETKGWIGGRDANIYETNDAGITWTANNVGGNLNRIFVLNNTTVFASGTSVYKYSNETLNVNNFTKSTRKPLSINILNNPVSDVLKFSIDFTSQDHILVELYDVNGKFIKKLFREHVANGNKEYEYNLKDISKGIYILNFHNNTDRQSIKFIKN